MTRELTAKQLEVLRFIARSSAANGYPPTQREIADAFGVTSNAIADQRRALVAKGMIRVDRYVARGMTLTENAAMAGLTLHVRHKVITETRCGRCNAATFDPEMTCPMCRLARLQGNRETRNG